MTEKTEAALPQICEDCARRDGCRRAQRPELMGGDRCGSCGYAPSDARQMALDQLRRTVYRALGAGATHTHIGELFTEVLNTLPPYEGTPKPLILWPGCW